MPALGGDAGSLVTPLNVLVGGQASPRDSGDQNRNAGPSPRVKSRAPDSHVDKHAEVLSGFFERQGRAVRGALGQKDEREWWDAEKWDAELAGLLAGLSLMTSEEAGKATAQSIGGEYDAARTENFWSEVSEREAADINATTREQVDSALAGDDPSSAVRNVFAVAAGARAAQMAKTLVTKASGFGSTEAGRQSGGGATKTWNTTSGNPRSSHAAMSGETVPIDDLFSNGMDYPGDGGDPDEVAGCQCEVTINIP